MCKCKAKWWALGAVAAVVAAVAGVRGCGGAGGGKNPQQQAGDIRGAVERTQAKIEERMADTNYVAGLDALAKRYDDLNAKRAEAMRELAAAKAQAGGAESPQGEDASKVAAAEEKIRKIDEEIESNRRLAVGFISTRLREQGEKGVGAELEAAAAERKAREKGDPPKTP